MDDPLLAPLRSDLDSLAALGVSWDDGTIVDAPVVACPGWTLPDLLAHVGGVARFASACVTSQDMQRPRQWPAPDQDAALGPWVREGADTLLAALGSTPATAERPSFAGPRTAWWWLRRQAAEMAVHRVDGQRAAGAVVDPVDPVVARAGVDEFLELICGERLAEATSGWTTSLHLHAPDGEWSARWEDGRFSWNHAHEKGEQAVRGDAGDLLLALWGRAPSGELQRFGDTDVLGRLQALRVGVP